MTDAPKPTRKTTSKKKTTAPKKADPPAEDPQAAGLNDASGEGVEVKKDAPPAAGSEKKTSEPTPPETAKARQGTVGRPFCIGHQVFMEAYKTDAGITYYRCPRYKDGCPARSQVVRPSLAAAFRAGRAVQPDPAQFDARPDK